MQLYNSKPYKPTPLEERLSTSNMVIYKLTRGFRLTMPELNWLGGKYVYMSIVEPELSYDINVDQIWLNNWQDDDYEIIRLSTVWAYPDGFIFGLPFPITEEAKALIEQKFKAA